MCNEGFKGCILELVSTLLILHLVTCLAIRQCIVGTIWLPSKCGTEPSRMSILQLALVSAVSKIRQSRLSVVFFDFFSGSEIFAWGHVQLCWLCACLVLPVEFHWLKDLQGGVAFPREMLLWIPAWWNIGEIRQQCLCGVWIMWFTYVIAYDQWLCVFLTRCFLVLLLTCLFAARPNCKLGLWGCWQYADNRGKYEWNGL